MKKKNNTVVFKVNNDTKEKMIAYYQDKLRIKTPPYAIFQAEEAGTIITLYESNKAMFQGSNAKEDSLMWQEINKGNNDVYEIISEDIEEKEKKEKKKEITLPLEINSIGSDEVGTGDYFGPIVVTASYVNKENIELLHNLGVRDSKKLLDEQILKIVPQFINVIPHQTIILNNLDYNKYHSTDMNMNKMKAILHNKVLYELVSKNYDTDYVVVDQFCESNKYYEYIDKVKNKVTNITFLTKAEDKVLSVACSSLISRYIFIKEINKIGDELGMFIPKGANDIVDDVAIKIVKKYGKDKLKEIAKLNFSNTKRIF